MNYEVLSGGQRPKILFEGFIFNKDTRSSYIYRCARVTRGCKCKLRMIDYVATLDGGHDHPPPTLETIPKEKLHYAPNILWILNATHLDCFWTCPAYGWQLSCSLARSLIYFIICGAQCCQFMIPLLNGFFWNLLFYGY